MYIDDGAGAPLDVIGKSMEAFTQSAAAGQFAVNETGGEALLAAIRRMLAWLREKRADLDILAQQPALGSSKAAEVIAPYVANVASDHQGFLTQLTALGTSLEKAEAAIIQAMTNYRETDQLNKDTLR